MSRADMGATGGMLLFLLGGVCRMYMLVRARGWGKYLSIQAGLTDEYAKLVADKKAPRWPLPASYVFTASGILVLFGSILINL